VAGLSATFSVTASGTAPLTYQWTKDGAPVSGATSSSYSISDVQAANVGTYQVIVTSAALLSDTSNGAILTVTPAAPSITTQPLSQTVSTGQNVVQRRDRDSQRDFIELFNSRRTNNRYGNVYRDGVQWYFNERHERRRAADGDHSVRTLQEWGSNFRDDPSE
jgi:hypothetical protein